MKPVHALPPQYSWPAQDDGWPRSPTQKSAPHPAGAKQIKYQRCRMQHTPLAGQLACRLLGSTDMKPVLNVNRYGVGNSSGLPVVRHRSLIPYQQLRCQESGLTRKAPKPYDAPLPTCSNPPSSSIGPNSLQLPCRSKLPSRPRCPWGPATAGPQSGAGHRPAPPAAQTAQAQRRCRSRPSGQRFSARHPARTARQQSGTAPGHRPPGATASAT